MAWFRRNALPPEHRPPLDRDERVVAWAITPAGSSPSTEADLSPGYRADLSPGPEADLSPGYRADLSPGPEADLSPGGPAGRSAGGALVATTRGLWLPAAQEGAAPSRLGWNEINKATWSGKELAVTPARQVAEGDGYHLIQDLPTIVYPLREPGELPHQVRARVTRSVNYTSYHKLPGPGSGGVRVVARRTPGVDGLTWSVRYDPGVDDDDPIVREATALLVSEARSSLTT
jgi:hypothetical protein